MCPCPDLSSGRRAGPDGVRVEVLVVISVGGCGRVALSAGWLPGSTRPDVFLALVVGTGWCWSSGLYAVKRGGD